MREKQKKASELLRTAKTTSTRIQSQFDGSKMQGLIEGRPNSNGEVGGTSQTSSTPSGILKTTSNFNQSDRKGQIQKNLARYEREEAAHTGSGSAQLNKRRVVVSEKQSPISLVQQKLSDKAATTLAFSMQGTALSNSNSNANRTGRKTVPKAIMSNHAAMASAPDSRTIQETGTLRGARGPADGDHQRQGISGDGPAFQHLDLIEKTGSSPNKNLNTSTSLQN
jgi:hypothetical protein